MLKQRILSTFKFFDLQDYPLTLLEIYKFLIADMDSLRQCLDVQGELQADGTNFSQPNHLAIDEILNCLEKDCTAEIENNDGFYFLKGRVSIVKMRLDNYFYGIRREKLIKKYINFLKYIPFVRGVALAGSQAMGQQKDSSDIDLLIITEPNYLWLARTLITGYFQITGKRRYNKHIANRFCLNHYLAGPKKISQLRNFYTASEYLKLRLLIGSFAVEKFQKENLSWINVIFPNAILTNSQNLTFPKLQGWLESMFLGKFGKRLEQSLKNWQLPKIRQEKFILVAEDELSFHPQSKQQFILAEFLKF